MSASVANQGMEINNKITEITKKRKKWVAANRENGFEDGLKKLLTELYPDNAHFIYELLQNADDPGATSVRFELFEDRLLFEHNGTRLFTYEDVDAITSIGTSTKCDDPTSIGKFGVGFKAVFAYTQTPEISSGSLHFSIHDLVVPVPEKKKAQNSDGMTSFVFPFDHPGKSADKAVQEIADGLEELSDETLLFLNNISRIEYSLPDGENAVIQRIEKENGHIEISVSYDGEEKKISHWLRYQNDVVINENGIQKPCRVAIAYSIREVPEEEQKANSANWKVVPLKNGRVYIFFPAEKEISNLKFHIHGPFASTVARDSIRNCAENRSLRDAIAQLVLESIFDICKRKMLTASFLEVLPNNNDDISDFYNIIRKSIIYAFKKYSLTPTKSGKYAPAESLYDGPSEISSLLNDKDMSVLTGYDAPLWVSGKCRQSKRGKDFIESLDIDEWGYSSFINFFCESQDYIYTSITKIDSENERIGVIEKIIKSKNDLWLMRFYALINMNKEDCGIISDNILRKLHCIRAMLGNNVEHVLPSQAYFPIGPGAVSSQEVYYVKDEVYSKGCSDEKIKENAKEFLEYLGIKIYDEATRIKIKLKNYCFSSLEEHLKDILYFIDYWKSMSKHGDTSFFSDYKFILADANEMVLVYPSQLVLDSPYKKTDLTVMKECVNNDKQKRWYINKHYTISKIYKKNLSNDKCKDFINFVKHFGLKYKLEIIRTDISNNAYKSKLYSGFYSARENCHKTNNDYIIEYLQIYINKKSIPLSRLIWQALISKLPYGVDASKALYSPNRSHSPNKADSQLVYSLSNADWIPDKEGNFRNPKDMTEADLRPDFKFNDCNHLLEAIGFGKNAREREKEYQEKNNIAKEWGFASYDKVVRLREFYAKCQEENIDDPNTLL